MAETIPGHILRREICNVIDGIAGRKVNVTFGGTGAFTNGVDQITLPAISHTEVYDLKDARVLRGYANHEVAHIRESTVPKRVPAVLRLMGETTLANKVEQTKAEKLNDLLEKELSADGRIRLRHLLTTENVFEDYRIEREQGAKFPGSHINIGVTRDHIVTREATTFLAPELEPGKLTAVAVGHAVGTWLGAIENKYPIAPLAQRLCDRIRDEIDPEAFAVVAAAWPRVVKTRSNGDVYPLAAEIGDALIAIDVARKQQEQQEEDNQPQGQDTGSSGTSGAADAADQDGASPAQGSAAGDGSDAENNKQGRDSEEGADGDAQGDSGENEGAGGEGDGAEQDGSNGGGSPGNQDSSGAGSSATPKRDPGQQDSAGDPDGSGAANSKRSASASDPMQGGGSPSTGQSGEQGDTSTTAATQTGANSASSSAAPSLSDVYGEEPHDFSDDEGIDIQDVIRRIVAVIGEQAANAMLDRMTAGQGASGAADGITRVAVVPAAEDQVAYRAIAKEARAVSGRVSAAMRSMMIGRARRTERRGLDDGAFDSRALYDIAIGSGSIYKQRSERIRVSGALLMLCDVSGSMTDEASGSMRGANGEAKSRLDILAEAVAAMSDGLGVNRDVKISLVTYTGDFQVGTVINVHKRFDQPYTAMRAGIGQINRVKNGGTPTGTALLDALAMMYPRNEKRRVITLITDGVADNPKLALNAAGCIMKSGIKFTGLGIGKSAPVMKVPEWRNIGDLNDLPNALIEIAKRHF